MQSASWTRDGNGLDKPSKLDEFHPRTNMLRQFRALFLKDLTLQWRAWKTNLCQLLTPVIFILFAGLIQVVVNHVIHTKPDPVPGTESAFPPIELGKILSCVPKNDSSFPHRPKNCTKNILNFYMNPNWQQLVNLIPPSALPQTNNTINITRVFNYLAQLSPEPCQKELFDPPFYYLNISDPDLSYKKLTGNLVPRSQNFSFSRDFNSTWNITSKLNQTCPEEVWKDPISLPVFWNISGREELNHRLAEVVQNYSLLANLSKSTGDQYGRTYSITPLSEEQYNTVIDLVENGSYQSVRPHAGIFIDKFHADPSDSSVFRVHYTLVAEELALYKLQVNKTKFFNLTHANVSKILVDVQRRSEVVNMVDNAIFKMLLNRSDVDEGVLITTYIMPIPPSTFMNISIDVASLVGGILYPFSASFLIPVFMASIVKDKYEKQLIMMEQNGLNRLTYWLVTYTFHYLLYIPIAIEIGLTSLIFQIRIFTQTSPLVLFVSFFLWGHAEVVLGFFFSNFFDRPRTATIVGYLIVIFGVIIALALEGFQVFPNEKTPFPVYMLYPPFTFYRILEYFINSCLSMRCYDVSVLSSLNLVTTAMLYLLGSTVLIMVLSVYLSYVLPGTYGVRKSLFFPITDTYKWLKGKAKRGRSGSRELERSPPPEEISIESDDDIDEDVRAEEESLRYEQPDAPLVMQRLCKEYPGPGGVPYVAVDAMSLAIQRNECFGLLGPNGAGKTTLISVLTGLYEPTSGSARIAGYDLATEMSAIHHHLGVCPQFDIHHADLTAEEHLLFYARLKAVKWRKEKVVVERALRQVNLYDARKKKSKNLSGGMRRRLSVAMACIGNPDILILDEPTTGLDPASRRQVWEVVQSVKTGRSVILTTHAMEEADHLCTRIGIMNFGKLRCLGTQTHLKTRFGTGYQLTFNCAPGQAPDVEAFVQVNLPYTVHVETYADSCTFKLSKEHLRVSELFPLLNSQKIRLGIMDWGIKMTTLEDVFLEIVQRHRDHRSRMGSSLLPAWLPCQHCLPQRYRQKEQADDE